MLRLKLVQQVPPSAVNMAYIRNEGASARRNVALLDYSTDIPENVLPIGMDRTVVGVWGKGCIATSLPQSLVSQRALVASYKSVWARGTKEPTYLYYVHKVGKGAYQDSVDWPIVIDPATLEEWPPVPGTAYWEPYRNLIEVVDDKGQPVHDIVWDVCDLSHDPGVVTQDYPRVEIMFDHKNLNGKTYMLKYRAYDTRSGETLPNHTEILNPKPFLPFENTYYYGGYWYDGHHQERFPILTRSKNCPGYYVSANTEQGTATYPVTYGFVYYDEGNSLDRIDFSSTPKVVETYRDGAWIAKPFDDNTTVKELCALVNSWASEACAVPMSQYDKMDMFQAAVVTSSATGTLVKLAEANDTTDKFVTHYKHRYDMAIRPARPFGPSLALPWYPRIAAGEFTELKTYMGVWWGYTYRTYVELRYGIPEFYNEQEWSQAYEPGVREIYGESPLLLDRRTVQLQKFPIHDPNSVVVNHLETGVITPRDMDLDNGKLYFDTDLSTAGKLSVSYAYDDNLFDYWRCDLNPLTNPDLIGKYVGLYVIPMQIRETLGIYTPGSSPEWVGTGEADFYPGYYGAVSTKLSGIAGADVLLDLNWLKLGYHTDKNSQMRVKLIYDVSGSPNEIYVYVYSKLNPSAADYSPDMVASGKLDSTDGSPWWVLLQEENGSGLTGRAYIELPDAPSPDFGTGEFQIDAVDTRRTVYHATGESVEAIKSIVNGASMYTPTGKDPISVARLIGIYQVNAMTDREKLGITDTRTRGGGLKEELDPRILQESMMNFDIGKWDGEPFQSGGSLVVGLPDSLPGTGEPSGELAGWPEQTGWFRAIDSLSEEDVQEKVSEYIAFGVYPMTEYTVPGAPEPTGLQIPVCRHP